MDMPGETIAPVVSIAAPDWATFDREILCPLCEYNLRGLTEPRCPECGHPFTWQEILDTEKLHPFLFEHHPEKNVRSFVRTYFASIRPWRFWKKVLPTHEPNPRRLILYWVTFILPTLFAVAGTVAFAYFDSKARNDVSRARDAVTINQPGFAQYRRQTIAKYGSIQNYLDQRYPMPPLLQLMRMYWLVDIRVIPLAGSAILWPWMTLLTLMIFRESMSQARIKPGHVMRCVFYSGAIVLPLVPLAIAWGLVIPMLFPMSAIRAASRDDVIGLLALAWLITMAGLVIAYQSYLRFPHSIATLLASQAIVALAMYKLYLTFKGF